MNVFIGCSANDNLKDVYYREAVKLADYLASNDCNLICGGSDGVMARLQEVFANKNKGVMIMEVECYRKDNYRYTVHNHNTIGERKRSLIEMADVIIFLPGGIGTMDEIFTTIESKRALEHNKEIIIVNINNYFDTLFEMFDKMYSEGFVLNNYEDFFYKASCVFDAIKYIERLWGNVNK